MLYKDPEIGEMLEPTNGVAARLNAYQRLSPALYVIDDQYNIILSGDNDPQRRTLPPFVADAVRSLQERSQRQVRRDDGSLSLMDGSNIIRISPVHGGIGTYTAVYVEQFRYRDDLRKIVNKYRITRRETQILRLLIAGKTTSELSDYLAIAVSTVVQHIKTMMSKTNSRTRTELLGKVMLHVSDELGLSAAEERA